MLEVKICGITNRADALVAVDHGVRALGFIFYTGSPRYIPPPEARRVMDRIPESVIRVGVFVNQPPKEIEEIFRFCRLHLVQLHGHESPVVCRLFPPSRVMKAITSRNRADWPSWRTVPVRGIVVDAAGPGVYGGTGRRAHWGLAKEIGQKCPLLLAGGLGEDNVAEAVRAAAPRALDLNSKLEIRPGKKDPEKIRRVMDIIDNLRGETLLDERERLFGPDLICT